MLKHVFTVGYADGLALVIMSKDIIIVEDKLNQANQAIKYWMEDQCLQLAAAKTEIAALIRKHIKTENRVKAKDHLKYMGVLLGMKQILSKTEKAARLNVALSKLLRSICEPKNNKRRLLILFFMSVTHSILFYGAELCADCVRKAPPPYVSKLTSVLRQGVLRISCAYSTVSLEAALVIAGVTTIDLLAFEKHLFEQGEGRC